MTHDDQDRWDDLRHRPGVATLLDALAGPPTADELAGEADVVAAMQAALPTGVAAPTEPVPSAATATETAPDSEPVATGPVPPTRFGRARRGRRRVVVRGAAVVGAVTFGLAGAAAAAGIVTVVAREWSDRSPDPTPPTTVEAPRPSASDRPGDGDPGDGATTCPDGEVDCAAGATTTTTSTTSVPGREAGAPGNGADQGNGPVAQVPGNQGQGEGEGPAGGEVPGNQGQGQDGDPGQGQGPGENQGQGQSRTPPSQPGPPSTLPPPASGDPGAAGAAATAATPSSTVPVTPAPRRP
ncbi:MAG TPA: hypothetical protein VIL36_16230 [Acidimicrobiales bacterium]